MKRLLPLLVLSAVGCAVEAPPPDDEHVAETKEPLSFTLPPGTFNPPPPIHPLPPGTPLPVIYPAWVKSCGAPSSHFTVLPIANSCQNVAGSGGTWTSRTIFAGTGGALCEVTWSGSSSPDYGALAAIAKTEMTAPISPPPAITAICGATSVCDPTHASCATLPYYLVGDVIHEGMAGCSSCAFVSDDTLYAEIPADFASSTVYVALPSGAQVAVAPGTSQTFRLNVLAPNGLARVYRY